VSIPSEPTITRAEYERLRAEARARGEDICIFAKIIDPEPNPAGAVLSWLRPAETELEAGR
jgi:hypothetical protein